MKLRQQITSLAIAAGIATSAFGAEIYHNRLAGGETIPAGTYGDITVLKDFSAMQLSSVIRDIPALSGDASGSFANTIKKVSGNTDVQTHTVSGWFKITKKSNADTVLWALLTKTASDSHAGYKVSVTKDGKLKVGKTKYPIADGGGNQILSTSAVPNGEWFYLTVAITRNATLSTRTATVQAFVNGSAFAMGTAAFQANQNGDGCTNLQIGDGVAYAGLRVDDTAVTDTDTIKGWATDSTYCASFETATWTGATSDDPSEPTNWSTGKVPDENTVVKISNSALPTKTFTCRCVGLTESITLPVDCNWAISSLIFPNNHTIDLNGHELKTCLPWIEGGTVTDSTTDTTKPGKLVFDVASSSTFENTTVAFTGNMQLVKNGAGTFMSSYAKQTYTGGTVVNAGTAMPKLRSSGTADENKNYFYGPQGNTITVNAGGMFMTQGQVQHSIHPIILNGGSIGNDNADSPSGHPSVGNVTLEADSYINNAKQMFVWNKQNSTEATTELKLQGHTLTKKGAGKCAIKKVDITGGGKIVLEKGELNIGESGFTCDDGTVFELKKDSSAYIWVQASCSVPTILGNGYIASSSNPLTVTKRYSGLLSLGKNGSSYPFTASNKLTLSGGATLDLNDNTDVYASQDYFAFGDGEITIDVSERDLTIGTQLVAWNSVQKKPSNTTFVWDDTTAAKGVLLVANDSGIFYGKEVVNATWTNALGDGDVTKPGNWTCYDEDGVVISGAVPADTTNLTIGDGKEIALAAGTTRTGSLTLGSGATLTIDMSAVTYIEGTMLIASESGLSLANGTVMLAGDGGSYELTSDSKALLYLPSKTVVARWDFNEYDDEAPLSTNILAATTGEAGIPCHYPGAGSTNITDGTIGGMSVVNPDLEAGNYAIAIPKYYHVKLPLPKTLQRSDWTIRVRFYTPSESMSVYRTFFSRDNTKEGDIFIHKTSNQVGGGGNIAPSGSYYNPVLAADSWHLLTVSQCNGFGAFAVDGEQSYTWTDNGKWNFFTDKDYLYLSADDSGEDGLLYIDYIELAVETPAHDSKAIVDGVLTSDVVLTNDQDWTSLTISGMNNKTIDLAGHTLTIASTSGTGKIYDSTTDATRPGQLVVNVAEGETYKNDGLFLSGNLRLVKEGAGTYSGNVQYQTYTGGTIVSNGTIKAVQYEKYYCLGKQGSDIRIAPNGVLELNGQYDWGGHTIYLDGGTLSNVGGNMTQSGWCGLANVTLTADSTISAKYHVVFNQNSSTVVELGGHTLNFVQIENPDDDKAQLYFNQTKIQNGTIVIGQKIVFYPMQTGNIGENVTIVNNGDFRFSADQTVLNFTDASMGYAQSCGKTMSVTGCYTPASAYLLNTKLMDGATLDLTAQTGPWTFQNAKTTQTLSFESGATIAVDVSGRTFNKGDQVVGWSAKPEGVTFQWDATTAEAGVHLSAIESGIYYGDCFTVTINDCGKFTIPNSVADEELDNVRLFNAAGVAVSNPVRNGRTITYDWEITDKNSWWDFEFNGNMNNTGTFGKNMTGEYAKSPYYNDETNALWVGHATPYLDVSTGFPEEFTAVIYGKMVNQVNNFEIGFGSHDHKKTTSYVSVSLACGDPDANEVQLLVANDTTVLKTVSMTVPNAYTADHLYAFVCKTVTENETDKTKVIVYLDGIEWDSYTFDGKVVLGNGFQVGSVHGGTLSGYSKATTANENSFLDFLRTYAVAFNSEAMAAYAAKYPYQSTNGNASRTFASSEDTWTADNAWSVTPYAGEAYATNIPPASALLTINATADATVTMNLDGAATYEQLKVTSGNAIMLKAGGTVMPTVSGLASVGADLTVDYNAIGIGKVMIAAGKTLAFDFAGFPIDSIFKTTSYEVTGAVTLGAGATIVADNLPSSGNGRTVVFGLNEYGHYALNITVEEKPFVFTIAESGEGAWTWGEQTLDEATVLAQSAGTIKKAGNGTQQFQGLSKFNYVVDAGTLKFTNGVDKVSSTITINENGTFDMNGKMDASYNFVLNGGALVNNGSEIGNSKRQFDTLVLTANSTIGGSGNFAFIRNSHDAGTVDLGGWTLAKTGSNTFTLDEGIVTNGTFAVNAGALQTGYSGDVTFRDATLGIGAEGTVSILEKLTLTVGEITGTAGATIANAGTLAATTLKGAVTLSGKGTWQINTLDDANVKLDQGVRNLAFAGNGTVDVVLSDDEIKTQDEEIVIFSKAEGAGEIAIGKVLDANGRDITSMCKIDGGMLKMRIRGLLLFLK